MFLPINIFVFCHCTHILYNIHNNIHTHFSIFYWILRINTHSTLLLLSSLPLYENMLLFFGFSKRQVPTYVAMRDVWMRNTSHSNSRDTNIPRNTTATLWINIMPDQNVIFFFFEASNLQFYSGSVVAFIFVSIHYFTVYIAPLSCN